MSDSDNQDSNGTSDEVSNQQPDTADLLRNLKSEISRKLQNSDSKLEALAAQNEILTQALQNLSRPSRQELSNDDLEELASSNPRAYQQMIKKQIKDEVSMEMNTSMQQEQQRQQVLNQLVSDYPELTKSDSELTSRAVSIYNSLSKSEQASSMSYKIAVRDAAAELGLLPNSKRKSNSSTEEWTSSGSSRSSQGTSSGNQRKKSELSDHTLAFAQMVGLDVSKPEVLKSLEKRAQRKKWSKYE